MERTTRTPSTSDRPPARRPPARRMYRAIVERDTNFEGVFVVGVTTTGIFCRPGCTAKTPRFENCEFLSAAKDAILAGYRACLRCRPLDFRRAHSPLTQQLLDLVEADPATRITDDALTARGIDPSTARRHFQRQYGMTFHAYQRNRRMGMALRTLRNDHDLASARRRSGYESESGFAAAFASIFGLPPRRGSDVPDPARARWFPTPLGPMVAIANDAGLLLLEFHDRRALATEIEWVQRHVGSGIVPGNSSILEQIEAEMIEYFAGRLREFATPLVAAGSPFQLRVWAELRRIPYGETRSYSQIAPSIGSPGAVRAVGKANGDNRLGVIIPCHRVIRADGELCGYGGGIWRKQKLLELEAAMPQSTLFDQRARQV